MEKFQIYYEPKEKSCNVRSFTLTISHINEKDDTYKLKIIKETINGIRIETHKIKEFHFGAKKILDKISQIDFDKKYSCNEEEIFFIKADNKSINASNHEEIQSILDLFEFDILYNINVIQYPKIKDVYEFIKLNNLFIKKIADMKDQKTFMNIYDFYIHKNPYKVFENMDCLENFIFS